MAQIVLRQSPTLTKRAAWFGLIALCFSAGALRKRLLAMRHWIDRALGGLLVGFGVMLAVERGTH